MVTASEMSCSDRLNSEAKVGMAGTKMLLEMGEKRPAMPEIATMSHLVDEGKAE